MSPLLAAGDAVVTLTPVATEEPGSTEPRGPAGTSSAPAPPLDAVAAAYAGWDLDAALQELEKLSDNCRSAGSS
jgi:hypothetical protein